MMSLMNNNYSLFVTSQVNLKLTWGGVLIK